MTDPAEITRQGSGCGPIVASIVVAVIAVLLVLAFMVCSARAGEETAGTGRTRTADPRLYQLSYSLSTTSPRTFVHEVSQQFGTKPLRAAADEQSTTPVPPPQQPQCWPHARALGLAQEQFGELPSWSGKDRSGTTFVMTLNPESSSWSLFACGLAKCCLVGTGGEAIFPSGA